MAIVSPSVIAAADDVVLELRFMIRHQFQRALQQSMIILEGFDGFFKSWTVHVGFAAAQEIRRG